SNDQQTRRRTLCGSRHLAHPGVCDRRIVVAGLGRLARFQVRSAGTPAIDWKAWLRIARTGAGTVRSSVLKFLSAIPVNDAASNPLPSHRHSSPIALGALQRQNVRHQLIQLLRDEQLLTHGVMGSLYDLAKILGIATRPVGDLPEARNFEF